MDQPNAISNGHVVVWQSLGSNGMIDTDEADLDHAGATRTIAHEFGPAIELALDGSGNVLVDSPDGKDTAATTLLRVNLATGHSSSTGLKNAHYPTVLGSRLISVTGRRDALTTVDTRCTHHSAERQRQVKSAPLPTSTTLSKSILASF